MQDHAGSMQNLALINQMVLEDKTFDIIDGDYDKYDGRCHPLQNLNPLQRNSRSDPALPGYTSDCATPWIHVHLIVTIKVEDSLLIIAGQLK